MLSEQLQDSIVIKGAREHNLKNIHLSIPRNKLIVITGPSGSGKSSLAFDTLYAEGQRRYVESLSAYARQFLEQLQKPDVDSIEGLSPSIAIEQKTASRNPRSTLGTITEIYDYLRVLYTRVGRANCPDCGHAITSQGVQQLHEQVFSLPDGSRIQILAPIVRGRKGEHKSELERMRRDGFIRARIDGRITDLTEKVKLDKRKLHTIEVVIDRLIIKRGIDGRLSNALDLALRYSELIQVNLVDEDRDLLFSKSMACLKCGFGYPEISPRFFSFNSPYGACQKCRGLGMISMDSENSDNSEKPGDSGNRDESVIVANLLCPECKGARLRKEALSVLVGGLNIYQIAAKTVQEAAEFMSTLKLSKRETKIAARVVREIKDRLGFLIKVGLSYLTLNRPAYTLSGGEAQRIRLATQIGSSLTGVLYILDEPSIGLHPRDCGRLLSALEALRDADNTVIVVEHDEETIRRADYVVDMGPEAGEHGGMVVCSGSLREIEKCEESPTGIYLRGEQVIPVPKTRRKSINTIKILEASEHNLKKINVEIPLGVMTCVTGVSGSGKSTLIFDILYKTLARRLYRAKKATIGRHKEISGIEKIDRVINIDQAPLGKSPRSNAATYTGLFSLIRNLFSRTNEARVRGYKPGRFSFNVKGGRCEECRGDGMKKIEMHYLPDVYVPCEVCKGSRFSRETLSVRYKDVSIADVMEMTVSRALDFFSKHEPLRRKLQLLDEVGLGYLKLGQSATTLSGGEAQRVKLARELSRRALGETFYILDEPTTGLHFKDIKKLLDVLNALVNAGGTVLVIEHNMEVIKSSDYVIDLGPEGGEGGGFVVATGTPEEVAKKADSVTGHYLKKALHVL